MELGGVGWGGGGQAHSSLSSQAAGHPTMCAHRGYTEELRGPALSIPLVLLVYCSTFHSITYSLVTTMTTT